MISKLRDRYSKVVVSATSRLGLDAGYFIRGGFYGSLQQVVGLSSGLAIAYAFGHFTTKAIFGEYTLILSILSLLSLVSAPGLKAALMRSIGEGYDSSLTRTVKARLAWSFGGIPLLLGAAYYYKQQGSDVLPQILMTMALFFPWLYAFASMQAFLVAKKRFDLHALFSAMSSILTASLVTAAVIFTNNLLLMLIAYLLGQIIPAVANYFFSKRLVKKTKKDDPDLLPYGYFLTKVQLLPTAVGHLSSILLAGFLGVDQLAVFSVAAKFPSIVQKNFDVFYKPVTAKLAEQTSAEHGNILRRHIGKFALMGIILFIGLWLFVPSLVSIFYGQQYSEAISLSRWYSLFILPLPLIWLLGDIMTFQKKRREIFFMSTVLPVIKLLAYFIIIPRWKILGLIAIMLAEQFLTLIYSWIVVVFASVRK